MVLDNIFHNLNIVFMTRTKFELKEKKIQVKEPK